jgi:metal-responsive CopG/Arc/MetJ family transcriptional regulator
LTLGINHGYTQGVKTAISIPDELFDAAEAASRRLGVTRSELYTRAVRAWLAADSDDEVRRRLDEVSGQVDSAMDPALMRLQSATVAPDRWT